MQDSGGSEAARARAPRSVLVLGGAGYVGSALVPLLLARGDRVRVVDRLLYGREALAAVAGHPRLELIEADIGACADAGDLFERATDVVHLAAIVGDPACDLDPELAARVNVTSTAGLVAAVRKARPRRFVFASTCAVYAASRDFLDERSATGPRSLYARTKLAAEAVVLGGGADGAATVLRFASLYGLSGRKRFDLVVNRFAAQAFATGRIALRGGAQWRPFLHVEDAARAIVAVLDAPPPPAGGEVLNAGSENLSIRRVAELAARAIPGAVIAAQPDAPADSDYRVRCDALRRRTAFAPAWTVRRGIGQVVRALRTGEVVDPDAARHGNESFLRERWAAGRAPAGAAP
jgi:nucleoside-diphosphate-sugar epimerase